MKKCPGLSFRTRFLLGSRPPHPQKPAAWNLEVGLLEDASQLCGCAALLCQLCQVLKDLLHQFQVVIPNGLQLRLLQPLMSLGCGSSTDKATQESPDATQNSSGSEPLIPTHNINLGPASTIVRHKHTHTLIFLSTLFYFLQQMIIKTQFMERTIQSQTSISNPLTYRVTKDHQTVPISQDNVSTHGHHHGWMRPYAPCSPKSESHGGKATFPRS